MKNREDNWFERLMLNENIIFAVIFINAVAIFVQETIGYRSWLYAIDLVCTIFFLVEMIVALRVWLKRLLVRWLEPFGRHLGHSFLAFFGDAVRAIRND